jgi:hypothetical protein
LDKLPWQVDAKATEFANKLQVAFPTSLGGKHGLEKTVFDDPIPFIVDANSNSLITRASVRDVYNEALRQQAYLYVPPTESSGLVINPPINRVVIEGDSFSGKSLGLLHALRLLLIGSQVVTLDDADKRTLYAFIPSHMETLVPIDGSDPQSRKAWKGVPKGIDEYTVYKYKYEERTRRPLRIPLMQNPDVYYLFYSRAIAEFPLLPAITIVTNEHDGRWWPPFAAIARSFYVN